jgi:hypothetical protein
MAQTKEDVKIFVNKWIDIRQDNFTTKAIKKDIKNQKIKKINVSSQVIAKFISESRKVKFDYNLREWVKLKPVIDINK